MLWSKQPLCRMHSRPADVCTHVLQQCQTAYQMWRCGHILRPHSTYLSVHYPLSTPGPPTLSLLVHATEGYGQYLMNRMRVDSKMPTCCVALQELGMPFKKWLEKHGLNLILPLFYETQTSQGYGYIEEVPTYYGTAQSSLHCNDSE